MILQVLEEIFDFYKLKPFNREAITFIMLKLTGKSSRISNSRDINTLIELGLIKMQIFPNFVLTHQALKLLKEIDAILPNEYAQVTGNLIIETIDTDKSLGDIVSDKTLVPVIPKKYLDDKEE